MLWGVLAVVVAVVLHSVGAHFSALDNDDQTLPTLRGEHPVGPTRWIKRLYTGGWLLSIVGAAVIGDSLWNSRPGVSIVIMVSMILLVNALPSLVVTLLSNRRLTA